MRWLPVVPKYVRVVFFNNRAILEKEFLHNLGLIQGFCKKEGETLVFWKKKKRGPFEQKLHQAEKRGQYVSPPDEIEITMLESLVLKIKKLYGSPDNLPVDFAKKAVAQLNLNDAPDALLFVWAFLKDEVNFRLEPRKSKYPRLRELRKSHSKEVYKSFYDVLSRYVTDLPRPAEGNVIDLIIGSKAIE